MNIIGIDKSLASMDEAIAVFEESTGVELTESDRAIFQYSWLVSATTTMREFMEEGIKDDIE